MSLRSWWRDMQFTVLFFTVIISIISLLLWAYNDINGVWCVFHNKYSVPKGYRLMYNGSVYTYLNHEGEIIRGGCIRTYDCKHGAIWAAWRDYLDKIETDKRNNPNWKTVE